MIAARSGRTDITNILLEGEHINLDIQENVSKPRLLTLPSLFTLSTPFTGIRGVSLVVTNLYICIIEHQCTNKLGDPEEATYRLAECFPVFKECGFVVQNAFTGIRGFGRMQYSNPHSCMHELMRYSSSIDPRPSPSSPHNIWVTFELCSEGEGEGLYRRFSSRHTWHKRHTTSLVHINYVYSLWV